MANKTSSVKRIKTTVCPKGHYIFKEHNKDGGIDVTLSIKRVSPDDIRVIRSVELDSWEPMNIISYNGTEYINERHEPTDEESAKNNDYEMVRVTEDNLSEWDVADMFQLNKDFLYPRYKVKHARECTKRYIVVDRQFYKVFDRMDWIKQEMDDGLIK